MTDVMKNAKNVTADDVTDALVLDADVPPSASGEFEIVEPVTLDAEQAKEAYQKASSQHEQRAALSALYKAWVPMLLDKTTTPTAVWDEFQELAVPFTVLIPFPDGAPGSCAKYLMEQAATVLIIPRPVTSNGQRYGGRYKPTAATTEDFKAREAVRKAWNEWMMGGCKGDEPK